MSDKIIIRVPFQTPAGEHCWRDSFWGEVDVCSYLDIEMPECELALGSLSEEKNGDIKKCEKCLELSKEADVLKQCYDALKVHCKKECENQRDYCALCDLTSCEYAKAIKSAEPFIGKGKDE